MKQPSHSHLHVKIPPLQKKNGNQTKEEPQFPLQIIDYSQLNSQKKIEDKNETSMKVNKKSNLKQTVTIKGDVIHDLIEESTRKKQMQAMKEGISAMEKKLNEFDKGGSDSDQEADEYRTKGGSKQVLEELDSWKNMIEHQKRKLTINQTLKMTAKSSPRLQQLRIQRKGSLLDSRNLTQVNIVPDVGERNQSKGDSEFKIRNRKNQGIDSKESYIEIEPEVNEIMLNNILTGEDEERDSDGEGDYLFTQQSESTNNAQKKPTHSEQVIGLKISQQSSISGSVPSSQRNIQLIKCQSQTNPQQSQKQVTFKEDQSILENLHTQAYDEDNSQNQSFNKPAAHHRHQHESNPPKKIFRQILQEANAELIEKLFLMKLRKRMAQLTPSSNEPHQMQDKEEDPINVIPESDLSESEAKNRMKKRVEFINKQQNIVKEEISLFQKKTLESFKFIQEIKKTKIGTPKLMGLVNGSKVGVMNTEWKSEIYQQQLQQEYALKAGQKSFKLEQELSDLGKHPDKLDEVHNKLFQKYAIALELTRGKKEEIEEKRLQCCKLSNVLQQKSEERQFLKKAMNQQLENPSFIHPTEIPASPKKILRSPTKLIRSQSKKTTRISIFSEAENLKHQAEAQRQMLRSQYQQVKADFYRKDSELQKQITELKGDFIESSHQLEGEYYQLQDLKHSKSLAKKSLKDFYISLLQFDKTSSAQPLISITKLIAYMQEIGEQINEKMMPEYFDKESIVFVKKIQSLYQQIDKLDDELGAAQKKIKSKLNNQMDSLMKDSRQDGESSPLEGEPYKKLMDLMLGSEVDHLNEVRSKLRTLSIKTSQKQSPSKFQQQQEEYIQQQQNQLYLPFKREAVSNTVSSPNEIESSQNILDFQFQDHVGNENQSIISNNVNASKKNEEKYLLLWPLKKGSLSVLSDQKNLLERLRKLQEQVQELKEQELERQVKLYYSVTSDEKIQNVQKLFNFIFGIQEGNFWFSKFMVRRKEIQIKSLSNKTFNFTQALFSKHGKSVGTTGKNESIDNSTQSSQKLSRASSQSTLKSISSKNKQLSAQTDSSLLQQKTHIKNNFEKLQSTSSFSELPSTTNIETKISDPFQLFISKQSTHIRNSSVPQQNTDLSGIHLKQEIFPLHPFQSQKDRNTFTPSKTSRSVHFPNNYLPNTASTLLNLKQQTGLTQIPLSQSSKSNGFVTTRI